MMNGRLKNAPYLDKQSTIPQEELFILAGTQAWQAYNKGKGEEWQLLQRAFNLHNGEIPIILGDSQLAELNHLMLTPQDKQAIKIFQMGKLTQRQISGICANLARFTAVNTLSLCNHIGEIQEDLSPYIARLREDNEIQKLIQQANENDNRQKSEPYIELRDNGILKGLYFITPKFDKDTHELISEKQQWLCDPLELVGNGKNDIGEYFYIFQWHNADEKEPRIEAINCGDFGTETAWRLLKNQGLRMTPKGITQNLVEHFHAKANTAPKWSVTHSTGWHNGAYLLPSGEIIGEPTRPIIFKNKSANSNGYNTAGTLESWQNEIAQYVNKNTSMMLGIATALASPLLRILGADSFGVHLFNASSKGKTTTLNIANSVYGNPSQIDLSWNTTPTALSNEASSRNDGFMTLDELGQAKKVYEVENIAYSLFNEKGRNQGLKEGGNNELNRWKITALSTGEKDVEGFLKSKGVDINAGQLVRLLNVPLTEANQLYHFNSNKAHADHLNEASKNNYGVIGREWIMFISEHQAEIKAQYRLFSQMWLNRLPGDSQAQVQRVASRFAILETALHFARHLTLWTEEDNREALIKSFNDWLADYGTGDREEDKIIEFFNDFFAFNAERAFIQIPMDPNQRLSGEIWGYRVMERDSLEKEHFYVYPTAFKKVIFDSSYPKKIVFETLERHRMIKQGKEQEKRPYQHKPSRENISRGINGNKRYYIFYPYLIDEE